MINAFKVLKKIFSSSFIQQKKFKLIFIFALSFIELFKLGERWRRSHQSFPFFYLFFFFNKRASRKQRRIYFDRSDKKNIFLTHLYYSIEEKRNPSYRAQHNGELRNPYNNRLSFFLHLSKRSREFLFRVYFIFSFFSWVELQQGF